MSIYEYTGNLHVHTCYSDGTALHKGVAEAAADAGIDFVIVTDHNLWVDGVEGYYDGVLVLVGEELHDVRAPSQSSHLLVFGADAELAAWSADAQALIDEAVRRGGLCYLAHPFERSSPLDPELDAIRWRDWDVRGYTGIELWNYMSEFKGLLRNRLAALLYAHFPDIGIRGPNRETLQKWDQLLLEGRRVSVIGAADAHGRTYSLGPLTREVFPYEHLFRCVNTHVLTNLPMDGDVDHDRRLIYDGLGAGRTWVGYDRIASTSGFEFRARSGANEALIGEELARVGAVVFEVRTPQPADTRLICNGNVIERSRGQTLKHTTAEPGIYRVEAYRRHWLERRGWIFSSPIYVS